MTNILDAIAVSTDEGDLVHRIRYTSAAKNDQVDIMLENYVNQHNVMAPIRRIEEGRYLFGTKKIYAKIINGKLMVRVGGGYMSIEEFVEKHQVKEIDKLKA